MLYYGNISMVNNQDMLNTQPNMELSQEAKFVLFKDIKERGGGPLLLETSRHALHH